METKRVVSHGAEHHLFEPLGVLDHGSVTLVDYLGNDTSVVAAARVCYATAVNPEDTERNQKLINYMMKNGHTSPFEQVVLTFRVKLPIFVARQFVRHRTARLNEISGRFSIITDEFYTPEIDRVQGQDKKNKQGSAGVLSPSVKDNFLRRHEYFNKNVFASYNTSLKDGIARELARIDLPLSTYTEWIWQMDLHNLFHFLGLRLDKHAQWEAQEYANAKAKIVQYGWPMCYAAFQEYTLGAQKLSATQTHYLRMLLLKIKSEFPESTTLSDEFKDLLEAVHA